MRRLILAGAIVSILLTATSAFATIKTKSTAFGFDKETGSVSGSRLLDLGELALWDVNYSAAGTISQTAVPATLAGGFNDKIWLFQYTTDSVINGSTNWQDFGSLIGSFTAAPGTTSTGLHENPAPVQLWARYLKLSYKASLITNPSSDFDVSASGSGSMIATSTPEPGSLMAMGSGLVGLAGWAVRRRKTA